ncbi:N-myc-interactor [Cheilinus undulatus]|uniref:N-myc-interactor n=1 Tax=Cheilinus undulatus TaxID=241271 RepID=UPI001BD4ABBD|nr:N-myc-interactor [Cheilinus undulatus]
MADMATDGEVEHTLIDLRGSGDNEMEEAKKELEMWKNKTKEAEGAKAQLTLEKVNEEEVKMKAQQEMMALADERDELKKEFTEKKKELQSQIDRLSKHKQDLMDKLTKHGDRLQKKKTEVATLKQRFKISAQIPDTEVEFSSQSDEQSEDDDQPIKGEFVIIQRASVPLIGGQALITFEEEKVASQILKMAKCSVTCDDQVLDVKPKKIILNPGVKFEVQLQISRKQLFVAEVPPTLPEETMKDKLMISFSRASRGGDEVKKVEYDQKACTAQVTFLHPGVADHLVLNGEYPVDLDTKVNVQVGPVYTSSLRRFQTFCGSVARTVLLDGIKDIMPEDELQDQLEIHFQKPRNFGGEIESAEYVSRKRKHLQAFFVEEVDP